MPLGSQPDEASSSGGASGGASEGASRGADRGASRTAPPNPPPPAPNSPAQAANGGTGRGPERPLRVSPAGTGRPWRTDAVLGLQARLTDRDETLLGWLADHHVLTTPQITRALFGSTGFAQRRLLTLHRAGLIDRFRPLRPGGGAYPWHYVLAHLGALHVAAVRDQSPPRPAATADRIRRIATSRTLDHRLGVNGFFTDLAGHARTHPGTRLERWWSEAQCAAPGAFAPGLISPIRPDGHGIWTETGDRRASRAAWRSSSNTTPAPRPTTSCRRSWPDTPPTSPVAVLPGPSCSSCTHVTARSTFRRTFTAPTTARSLWRPWNA